MFNPWNSGQKVTSFIPIHSSEKFSWFTKYGDKHGRLKQTKMSHPPIVMSYHKNPTFWELQSGLYSLIHTNDANASTNKTYVWNRVKQPQAQARDKRTFVFSFV